MHSHNKPFTYTFSLTLYSPHVMTHPPMSAASDTVCTRSYTELQSPCQYFLTLTTKCSLNVWTFETQIMPTPFSTRFCFHYLRNRTKGCYSNLTSGLDLEISKNSQHIQAQSQQLITITICWGVHYVSLARLGEGDRTSPPSSSSSSSESPS